MNGHNFASNITGNNNNNGFSGSNNNNNNASSPLLLQAGPNYAIANGYNISGVIDFMLSEWRRFEKERDIWTVEKSELQNRISVLEAERKSFDNIKIDLLRRIKMLEFALRQERIKYTTSNSTADQNQESGKVDESLTSTAAPAAATSHSVPSSTSRSLAGKSPKSSEFLRKYLEDMNLSDAWMLISKSSETAARVLTSGDNSYYPAGTKRSLVPHAPKPTTTTTTTPKSILAPPPSTAAAATIEKVAPSAVAVAPPVRIIPTSNGSDADSTPPPSIEVTQAASAAATVESISHRSTHEDESESALQVDAPVAKQDDDSTAAQPQPPPSMLDDLDDEQLGDGNRTVILSSSAARKVKREKKSLPSEETARPDADDDIDELSRQASKQLNISTKDLEKLKRHTLGTKEKRGRFNSKSSPVPASVDALKLSPQDSATASSQISGAQPSKAQSQAGSTAFNAQQMAEIQQIVFEEPVSDTPANTPLPTSVHRMWKPKYTLRSHLDAVRSIAFHPTKPLLLSGSEDNTLKLWNLTHLGPIKKSKETADVDPIFTFRGHTGQVFSVAFSSANHEQECVFSAGADAAVRIWELPSMDTEPYTSVGVGIAFLKNVLVGHTDAIWELAVHPVETYLLSASADATLKLWDFSQSSPLQQSYSLENVETDGEHIPTTVQFVQTDVKKLVAGYSSSYLCLFDAETAQTIWKYKCSNDTTNPKVESIECAELINQVRTHPTLPLAITAHEDHSIRFFDINSGKCVHKMIAHLDSVACLDIDPSGLYYASVGHESSLRVWDLSTKSCVQEISAHRKKYDESIHSIAYHQTKSFLGSGGADALVKLYQ